ncbi:MAG: hypothetical protein NTW93_11165 [Phycisphaerae bacterium]|nr:hypothetical protein [Phycisphaerae bacterium]
MRNTTLIMTVIAGLIVGFILWLILPEQKPKTYLFLQKMWRWIKLHLRHKETPEEAAERHRHERLESDDPDVWKS